MHEYYTPEQVAEILGVTEGTLANWRSQQKGPPYEKNGRAISYRVDLFEAWREGNTVYPERAAA